MMMLPCVIGSATAPAKMAKSVCCTKSIPCGVGIDQTRRSTAAPRTKPYFFARNANLLGMSELLWRLRGRCPLAGSFCQCEAIGNTEYFNNKKPRSSSLKRKSSAAFYCAIHAKRLLLSEQTVAQTGAIPSCLPCGFSVRPPGPSRQLGTGESYGRGVGVTKPWPTWPQPATFLRRKASVKFLSVLMPWVHAQ